MDNKSELTFQASELAALGLQVGQSLSSIGWEMATVPGPGTVMNNLSLDVTEAGVTTNVYFGNYSAIVGWNDFAFSTPVVWNGGDIVVTSCHDNSSYTAVNSYYYTNTPSVSVSFSYQDLAAGSICNTAGLFVSSSSNISDILFLLFCRHLNSHLPVIFYSYQCFFFIKI